MLDKESSNKLSQCDIRIQEVLNEASKITDFKVVCGYRNKAEQNLVYKEGYSRVEWPNSKHNRQPSLAVDIVPVPFKGYHDHCAFSFLAGVIKAVAYYKNINIIWGGNWHNLLDLCHFELDS